MNPFNLKSQRKASGYSQAALADALGVSRCTVNRWEAGKQPIPKMVQVAIKCLQNNQQNEVVKMKDGYVVLGIAP